MANQENDPMQSSGCSAEGLEPFALRVIGDSMSPEFEDGHVIVVDPGYPLVNGAFAVIDIEGEILFAQYFRRGARQWLQYLNPNQELRELSAPFRVKGVVTQRNSRRRKDTKHYDYPMMP
jgi:SOS-response transcriptional repressor LexA